MKAIYKCELCGKEFETFTTSKNNADFIMVAFAMDDIKLLRERHLNVFQKCTHLCGKNGDIGLAHFIGFIAEKEDSSEND